MCEGTGEGVGEVLVTLMVVQLIPAKRFKLPPEWV